MFNPRASTLGAAFLRLVRHLVVKRSGALVSSGLGGGSLIYANIHLRGLPGTVVRGLKFLKMRLKYRTGLNNDANLSAEISNLLGPANTTLSSFPVIAMRRDFANGRLFLKGDLQGRAQTYGEFTVSKTISGVTQNRRGRMLTVILDRITGLDRIYMLILNNHVNPV